MTDKEKLVQQYIGMLDVARMLPNIVADQMIAMSKIMGEDDPMSQIVEKVSEEGAREGLVEAFAKLDFDTAVDMLIPTYAKLFDTEDEVREAIAWQTSPVGRKMHERMTDTLRGVNDVLTLWSNNRKDVMNEAIAEWADKFLG